MTDSRSARRHDRKSIRYIPIPPLESLSMSVREASITCSLMIAGLTGLLGFWAGSAVKPTRAQETTSKESGKLQAADHFAKNTETTAPNPVPASADQYLRQSPAARASHR